MLTQIIKRRKKNLTKEEKANIANIGKLNKAKL